MKNESLFLRKLRVKKISWALEGCVQKSKLLASVLPRMFLLALIIRYRGPGQKTIRDHFALLNAAQFWPYCPLLGSLPFKCVGIYIC